jgi:hypothetical protein
MYQFAVIALLALATVKLVDFLVDFLPSDDRGVMRSLLTFIVAVGGVWLCSAAGASSCGTRTSR